MASGFATSPVTMQAGPDYLGLADWRRRVGELYAAVRAASSPHAAFVAWRAGRDELFSHHAHSPLSPDERRLFSGLSYYPYDQRFRVVADVRPLEPEELHLPSSGATTHLFKRFGRAEFTMIGKPQTLDLFWLEEYSGGVFLSFRDATSALTTYGAGRYLLDTAKGADLGAADSRLVLDFNFSYNPSCAYDAQWVCPLPPASNRLDLAVEAGERTA